jgi:type I restriction-modification system DNA methylase subunit
MPSASSDSEGIRKLVELFDKNQDDYLRPDSQYNETQLRLDFIDPFFQALGWDVKNRAGSPQHLREVVHEVRVKSGSEWRKKPDYTFRLAGTRKFFVETKRPSLPIDRDATSVFQLRRYGWSAKLPISVLTNFKNLAIYDCRYRPHENDDPRIGRLKLFYYEQYEQNFDEIHRVLSRDSVYSGEFDKEFTVTARKGTNLVDDYFLTQIEGWRKSLAVDLLRRNPHLSDDELNYLTEILINRIVFLRICEDRGIEKYEELLNVTTTETRRKLLEVFRNADKKYNSGIFDFAKDSLSPKVSISDNVLVKIIKDLYYPRSPYAFSVIDSNILGQIYELFLTKKVAKTGKHNVKVVTKPEISHDRGIVTTPRFIVQEIVTRAVKPLLEGSDPTQISKFRFADIACGSGSFLLELYGQLLDYHLNWCIDQHDQSRIYRGEGDHWFLTLQEKKRILLDNIYGVDVDPNAVEVTQFGLLVRLLEDETEATVSDLERKGSVLPSLDENIRCGNSLVDKSIFKLRKASELPADELERLHVFNWNDAFPMLSQSRFDAIIGNPPYTRIQVMKKLSPFELKYYQEFYKCGKADNFDKYYLFIERALSLVKHDGIVGFIVPHKFMKIKAGESLRKLITDGSHLKDIVHFGKEQVFERSTTTYTCILTLSESSSPSFKVELVANLQDWKYHPEERRTMLVNASEIDYSPWLFMAGPLKSLTERLRKLPKKLSDIAEIFVGLQTSMDDVYLITPQSVSREEISFTDFSGKSWEIEKEITRKAIYNLQISPFMRLRSNSRIIFPYYFTNGNAFPYSEKEMRRKFPEALKYLCSHKRLLLPSSRNVTNPERDKWFKYGRSQSLTRFDGREKLIVKVLSLEPCFTYDDSNLHFTGGGNGPYYGVSLRPGQNISILFLQGVLNSKLMDLFVKSWSSVFRAGYYSYGKQFIRNLPMADIDLSRQLDRKLHDRIAKIVKKLIMLSTISEKSALPSKRQAVNSRIESLKDELETSVYELYHLTDEEEEYLKDLDVG